MFMAIANPTAAVENKLLLNHPRRGGMQLKDPLAATIRQP
jgi:hypothetical protein